MKIYRRMDIGTAKPSAEARAEIPHHCIDVAEPSESFSAARFVDQAEEALTSIATAGAVALAVGGTSLYIKALSEGLFEAPPGNQAVREALRAEAAEAGLADLHRQLADVDPDAAGRIHPNDERRIVRALEVYRTTGTPITELQAQWDSGQTRHRCIFIGLRRERDEQSRRINARVRRMVDAGLRDEVAALLAEPNGLSPQAAAAVGQILLGQGLRRVVRQGRVVDLLDLLVPDQEVGHRPGVGHVAFDPQVQRLAGEIDDARRRLKGR